MIRSIYILRIYGFQSQHRWYVKGGGGHIILSAYPQIFAISLNISQYVTPNILARMVDFFNCVSDLEIHLVFLPNINHVYEKNPNFFTSANNRIFKLFHKILRVKHVKSYTLWSLFKCNSRLKIFFKILFFFVFSFYVFACLTIIVILVITIIYTNLLQLISLSCLNFNYFYNLYF